MTKSVATRLAVFAGLMLILFGLKTGLTEHYLEPTGITEIAYSSERGTAEDSLKRDDSYALSCGTAWSPYEAAPTADVPAADATDSKLSGLGQERCKAVLAGVGWSAALLLVSGAGIWLILLFNAFDRWLFARHRAEDAEMEYLARNRRAPERRGASAAADG
jgi:hypothetical protein